LIEKSGAAMSSSGQIPHHFNAATPKYTALSGATQTGPNIFWIAAALQYVKATGDYDWLRAQMPTIERALGFLTNRYDPAVKLVNAPGPLWIDVFIRQNFTADTNAFMVEILRQVADAEALLGNDGLAGQRRAMADNIVAGMNDLLWAGDHYVTQLNPDGSTRDLVDYDANLLAVGFGVAPPDRAQKILARVDSGPCTHARPSWVSERTYGSGDTYGGNTGDSAVTMGRIGWADAQARRRVGDRKTFDERILGPVEADLLSRTWLTERYDCSGNATRAPYYYEYPSLVAMLLRETAYGIDVGLQDVDIDPFSRSDFRYHLGSVDVTYSGDGVALTLPGSGIKRYAIHGQRPGATYRITVTGANAQPPATAVAGPDGVLRFSAPIGPGTTVTTAPPGSAAGAGAGSSASAVDRTAPRLRVSARRRQRARRYLRVAVTCDERCSATLQARALRRRAGSLRRTLAASRRTTLRVKLTRRFRSARHRALRRHRSIPLTLRVRAA